jgi:hypothetical protein
MPDPSIKINIITAEPAKVDLSRAKGDRPVFMCLMLQSV